MTNQKEDKKSWDIPPGWAAIIASVIAGSFLLVGRITVDVDKIQNDHIASLEASQIELNDNISRLENQITDRNMSITGLQERNSDISDQLQKANFQVDQLGRELKIQKSINDQHLEETSLYKSILIAYDDLENTIRSAYNVSLGYGDASPMDEKIIINKLIEERLTSIENYREKYVDVERFFDREITDFLNTLRQDTTLQPNIITQRLDELMELIGERRGELKAALENLSSSQSQMAN